MAPPVPIIGIDPHKRSHTAVVLDDCEEVIAHLRIDAGHCQADQLLAWAPPDPARVWAIENANGLGYLLAQQLIARGETVVDVPATMAARARKLSGKSGTKTDAHDARSVAIAAAHHRSLRQIIPEDLTTVIGLLLDRRWQLVSQRQRTICQLHATLTDLTPAGAKTHLTCDKTVALLRRIRPVTAVEASRKQVAQELLEDWRWLNRRIPPAEDRLFRAVAAHGTTLTSIYGVGDVGAATIISIVGDVTRYPTAGHFAAFCGTAPLQASSGDIDPSPAVAAGQPATQQGAPRRGPLPGPQRRARPGVLPPQDRGGQRPPRGAPQAQAPTRHRGVPPTAGRPGGSGRTSGDETEVRVTGSHPVTGS